MANMHAAIKTKNCFIVFWFKMRQLKNATKLH